MLFGLQTIFENDIGETVLWHEQQQYPSRFERFGPWSHNQDSWRSSNREANRTTFGGRSSSLNAPPEFIHKGGGVGWGSGRGKPDRINRETLNDRMSSFSPFCKQQSNDHGGSNYHHQSSNNVPYSRGRGRTYQNSNNVYSSRHISSSSSNSLRPQWSESTDKSRW